MTGAWRSNHRARPRRRAAAWVALGVIAPSLAACADLARRLQDEPGESASTRTPRAVETVRAAAIATVDDASDVARRLASNGANPGGEAPGSGIVAGRVVDAVTGLPVPDAGISLLEPGRRAITGADGAFRFEGVERGDVTVILGPADGYVARGTVRTVSAHGLDAGLLAMLPVGPATLVDPEFGGEVVGCRATRVSLPTGAIAEPLPISVTCIDRAEAFPAPPPVGRLPLAVVDLAPGAVPLARPVPFEVELPAQPRYAPGVVLDVLRLDATAFAWQEAGTLVVDAGGGSAVGRLPALGTYLFAAPPFGAFEAVAGARPTIRRYNVSSSPDGAPSDVFPDTILVVYAAFDYGGMDNTAVSIRTTDAGGRVVWETTRPYLQGGSDAAPMVAPDGGAWPAGRYTTAWYVGDPPVSVGRDVTWSVARRPTPAPTPFDAGVRAAAADEPEGGAPSRIESAPPGGAARGGLAASAGNGAGAVPSGAGVSPGACGVPFGWWQYIVRPGDTLSGLGARFGADAASLAKANCLTGEVLRAGAAIYVPQPATKYQPAWPAGPTPQSPSSGPTRPAPAPIPWPTKERSPIEPTLQPYPTSWYTPPAALPVPGPGAAVAPPVSAPRQPPAQAPAPPPAVPPAPPPPTPTPVPPKDPAPAEPTLAPRPSP